MTKSKKQPPTFKLGNLEISYIEIGGEAVAITSTGVKLIIDNYFNDQSIEDIPHEYYFNWGFGETGYLFTVINYLYGASKGTNRALVREILPEALPCLIDPKNGLIKKPELSPADLDDFNSALKMSAK